MTDWKPINPCDECGVEIRHCPLLPNACHGMSKYIGAIDAQKQLLEYLMNESEKYGFREYERVFESMLKELEEK